MASPPPEAPSRRIYLSGTASNLPPPPQGEKCTGSTYSHERSRFHAYRHNHLTQILRIRWWAWYHLLSGSTSPKIFELFFTKRKIWRFVLHITPMPSRELWVNAPGGMSTSLRCPLLDGNLHPCSRIQGWESHNEREWNEIGKGIEWYCASHEKKNVRRAVVAKRNCSWIGTKLVCKKTDVAGERARGGTWGPTRVRKHHHRCWRPLTQS